MLALSRMKPTIGGHTVDKLNCRLPDVEKVHMERMSSVSGERLRAVLGSLVLPRRRVVVLREEQECEAETYDAFDQRSAMTKLGRGAHQSPL